MAKFKPELASSPDTFQFVVLSNGPVDVTMSRTTYSSSRSPIEPVLARTPGGEGTTEMGNRIPSELY